MRGKPSRMNEASGEEEGRAGATSAREVLDGTQDLDFSSERMRRRIMSSGTREPDCMWDSASWPAMGTPLEAPRQHGRHAGWETESGVEDGWAYPRGSCCERHCARDPQSSMRTIGGNAS